MEIVHGSVYGYRTWYLAYNEEVRLPELHPIVVGGKKWSYGITEAECISTSNINHSIVPEDTCNCGLYAVDQDSRAHKTLLPSVFGRIEMFGRVIYHEKGYRAQYAKVYSLDSMTLCGFCLSRGDIYRNISLEDENTTVTFDVTRSIAGIPLSKMRWAITALCQECAKWIANHYGYTIKEPPFSIGEDFYIAKSKPLFGVLTQLYCDGRILYLTG